MRFNLNFAVKPRWALAVLLAGLPFVLQSNSALSGPGSDNAIGDNRAAMCSLPPFLNVAITEKPNIMVLYDNSTSMSLAAYTRPYNGFTHYYGIFDSDGCYSSNGRQFSKDPSVPNETAEVNGIWEVNPAWKAYNSAKGHPTFNHICQLGSAYQFSGNFLNWATMRRIDLLRKAFTGGMGSNSGTQDSQYLAGEGIQTGGDKLAPCFSKSYTAPGVSPYTINQVKVVDGTVTWGTQCAFADETITAKLEIPRLQDGSRLANAPDVREGGYSELQLPKYIKPGVSPKTPVVVVDAPRRVGRPTPMRPVVTAGRPAPILLASLFDVMRDTGLALVSAPPPDLIFENVSLTPNKGSPGDTGEVSFRVNNQGGAVAVATVVTFTLKEGTTDWLNGVTCSYTFLLGLPAGATSPDIKCPFMAPLGYSGGTYSLTLAVVGMGSNTATVFFTFPSADLRVTNLAFQPKAGIAGMPVGVAVQIENVGALDLPLNAANHKFAIYLRSGATDNLAGTCDIDKAIAAGTRQDFFCAVNVPSVGTGAYVFKVLADSGLKVAEESEVNNTYCDAPVGVLTTCAAVVNYTGFYVHKTTGTGESDLAVVSISPAAGSGLPGGSETVTVRVANVGSTSLTLTNGITIVLSGDRNFTSGDLNLGTCATGLVLPVYNAVNWVRDVVCTVTIPAGVAPSSYPAGSYIAAVVPANTVNETGSTTQESSDKSPNSAGAPYFIQLTATDLTIQSMTATPNSNLLVDPLVNNVSVTLTVRNLGRSGNLDQVEFYLSDDAVTSSTDTVLTPTACGVVMPTPGAPITIGDGASATGSCSFSITKPLGTYYIIAKLISSSEAAGVKNNNTRAVALVVGAAAAGPDLILSFVDVPALVGPAQTLNITITLTNIGSLATPVTPSVEVYLSVDAGIMITQRCSGTKILASGGGSETITCGVAVPPDSATTIIPPTVTVPGTYAVSVTADPDDVVPEPGTGAEANNQYTGSTYVDNLTSCSGANCTHDIKVDWGGRGRVGILWSFRAKVSGAVAPANLGVATLDDWLADDPWTRTGNGFQGVHQNQQPANNIIPHLEAAGPVYSGKLARSLLNVLHYFSNEDGFGDAGPSGKIAGSMDPMFYDPIANKESAEAHMCRKNFILLISDGYSFNDEDALPTAGNASFSGWTGSDLKDFASDFSDPTASPTFEMLDAATYELLAPTPEPGLNARLDTQKLGSYHLDNVARYGHDFDLRTDIKARQSVNTVVVHTFASSDVSVSQAARATHLMKATAVQGGYVEQDLVPDGPTTRREWDADFNGVPDTYFEAKEGDDIGEVILNALNSILLKTASGTSVSVIASTTRGEGAVYQSYFRPTTAEGATEVNWLGFLQGMWVDKYGNMREDSDHDGSQPNPGLSMIDDYIVKFEFNTTSKETLAVRWKDTDGDGTPDQQIDASPRPLTRLTPIFEAGKVLWGTPAADREIFTWPHSVTEAIPSAAFETMPVDQVSAPVLQKYLWPAANYYYNNEITITEQVIDWIRGDQINDVTFRNKLLTIDGQTKEWKLGDIVYSTPTIVGSPEERYDIIYGAKAEGYYDYFAANRDRRRIVLIGANDGMLHAFNGGVFRDGDNPATAKEEAAWFDAQEAVIGQELWSYVPGSLLQNLRMLVDVGYDTTCHIYYVDLKPKVTDVQIFFDTATKKPLDGHPQGWGTILIGGMRLGCGLTQFSSYFILDITNPTQLKVLAEFGPTTQTSDGSSLARAGTVAENNLAKLNFSFFYPIVLRTKDADMSANYLKDDGSAFGEHSPGRWYLIVGSGPSEVKFKNTAPNSAVYVFDLTKLGLHDGPTIDSNPSVRYLQEFAYAINTYQQPDGSMGGLLPTGAVVANGLTADLDGDYNVDAAYFTTQIDAGLTATAARAAMRMWGSEVWRLNTVLTALDVPVSPKLWALNSIFSTGTTHRQPAVAAPAIARDPFGNTWVYFGTGRFIYKNEGDDEINDLRYGDDVSLSTNTTYQQSLYGFIDPCWDATSHISAVGYTCPQLTPADLVDTTAMLTKLDPGSMSVTVEGGICSPSCTMPELATEERTGTSTGTAGKFGWHREIGDRASSLGVWEMAYNKPAVAGGLVLFTTYLPEFDLYDAECALAGDSYLWVLDYQTGVASGSDVFSSVDTGTTGAQAVEFKRLIGHEPPSPPAIFGKSVFVQGSNANITRIQTNAVFRMKPHVRSWQEQ